jgi:hypothetical protein
MLRLIEHAERTATAPVIEGCDLALETDGALGRLLAFVEDFAADTAPPAPTVVIQILTGHDAGAVAQPIGSDDAQVFVLSDARDRQRL